LQAVILIAVVVVVATPVGVANRQKARKEAETHFTCVEKINAKRLKKQLPHKLRWHTPPFPHSAAPPTGEPPLNYSPHPFAFCAQDAAHKTCYKRQFFLGGFLTKQMLPTREKHAKCIGKHRGGEGVHRGGSGLIEKSIVCHPLSNTPAH